MFRGGSRHFERREHNPKNDFKTSKESQTKKNEPKILKRGGTSQNHFDSKLKKTISQKGEHWPLWPLS